MGLTANGVLNGYGGRLFGVAQGAFAKGMASVIHNAAEFGPITSVPQGYNNPLTALRMTITVGGNISARFSAELNATAELVAIGNMAASVDGEFNLVADGNVGLNGYATFEGEFDVTAAASSIGNMAANMDLIARPSANDIAQEVWNAQSAAFQSAGTLGKKLSDTKAAADLAAALSA